MENKTEKAYKEIFKILNKHKDVCMFDIDDLKEKSEYHLFGIELKEKHGLNINPKEIKSLDYSCLNSYTYIYWCGEKYRRNVSWSDDGTQPKDELLLVISFPTGAYIFGDDYPEELFKKFFLELKTYNSKYTDTHNHSLYFSMDNASEVFNKFDSIFNKYVEMNKKEFKQRKIQKMKKDLAKLESN